MRTRTIRMRSTPLLAGIACFAALNPLIAQEPQPVDFAHDVLPLLNARCVECHADGRYEADFSIDTRETILAYGAAEPGAASDSVLIDRVTSDDPDYRMPPEGPPLIDDEVAVLRRWIDEGLTWEPGFTLRENKYQAPLEPRRPELPPIGDDGENPIDRIVGAYWRAEGVAPPPLAGDAAFCRRVYLDLTGLLPTPAALAAYVSDDDPDKRTSLVRRLLADDYAYADHWLSFWNDLLRNDYAGTGYIDGGRLPITGWLYRALLENKPYDDFVRELIAPGPEAAGFAKGIVWRGEVNASQRPELQFSQNVGHVFLGINLKCASCHDSFVDDWKLTDAYGLAAIIAEAPLELHRCDKPTGELAEARFLFPELGRVDVQAPHEARLRQLAVLMTHPQNGRLTRTIVNRLWQRLMGRGIVHPVDSMGTAPWSADLLDYLAVHMADSAYDLKATLELIAASQAYGRLTVAWDDAAPVDEYVFAGPAPKRMTAEQFVDALAALTGVAPEETVDDVLFGHNAVDEASPSDGGSEDGDVQTATDVPGPPRPFVRAALVKSSTLMRTLGRPERAQVVTMRPATLTTLEALQLTNGEPLATLLLDGAEALIEAHPDASTREVCAEVFAAALSRDATEAELDALVGVAGEVASPIGLADALWCIVMLPEFQTIR